MPVFVVGLGLSITLALGLAFFRGSALDFWGVVVCVVLMSISALFFIVAGQFVFGRLLQVVPISGFDTGADLWRFLLLPVARRRPAGRADCSRGLAVRAAVTRPCCSDACTCMMPVAGAAAGRRPA